MKMYLLHSDNTFSDFADYIFQPDDREDGTWVEGEPVGIKPYVFVPLSEQLSQIFDAQPAAIRAQFAPLRAAIKLELDLGHIDVVKAIIEGVTIPSELESLRQEILDKLN